MSAEAFPPCWCGASDGEAFNASYRRCAFCGTLISARQDPDEHYKKVDDDETGFYGVEYWRDRVPRCHGLPTLEERARTDFTERALAWLEWLLSVRRPPAQVLELGCAHGGFVYLLNAAEFDAIGLEMSPRIIAEARERFGVTVHRGPLEDANLDQRFDVIAAMDVLEHLVDPLETLRAARDHLAPGGLLLLQTPCYRDEGPDWEMFLPDEHLFLFDGAGVERLLKEAGFPFVRIEPGYFSYDMWIAASPEPLAEPPASRGHLPPLVQALLDSETTRRAQSRQLAAIEEDRDAKDDLIARLNREREAIELDRDAKDDLIVRLNREKEAIEADRSAKDDLIARLNREKEVIEADRGAKDDLIARLSRENEAIDADRQAKDELITRVARELEIVRADQQARGEVIERLEAIRQHQERELQQLKEERLLATSTSVGTSANRLEKP